MSELSDILRCFVVNTTASQHTKICRSVPLARLTQSYPECKDYDQIIRQYLPLRVMGEAKRRKEALGDKYGQEPSVFSKLTLTKKQSEQFVKWTTQGAWVGIGLLIAYWVTVRFIGPSFGWWQIN